MSIISSYEVDNSPALARRFASLTRSYFEDPSIAKDGCAQIPLENIYRMLEMFRYGSFQDESRLGVLALQGLEKRPEVPLSHSSSWHAPIEVALEHAVNQAYGNVQKDEVINELEDSLRWLATGKDIPDDAMLKRAREFFAALEARI